MKPLLLLLLLLVSISFLIAEDIRFLPLNKVSDDWEVVKVAIIKDRTQSVQYTFTIRNQSTEALKVGGAKGQANANLSLGQGHVLFAEACHLPHTNMTIEPGAVINATVPAVDSFEQDLVNLVIFVEGERISLGSMADITKNGQQDGAGQPATALDSKEEGVEKPQPESERRSQ